MRLSIKLVIVFGLLISAFSLLAAPLLASDSNTVRIYVDGEEQTVSTKSDTVGEALERSKIKLGDKDLIEPGPETKITKSGFNINIFRARPVMIVDQDKFHKVVTAHQSPQLIAESAGLEVFKEDRYSLAAVTDFVDDEFIGEKLTIDRATPVIVHFDGEKLKVRTQMETIGEMLKEQGIKVTDKDTLNHKPDKKLTKDMDVIITRIGHKLITEKIDIPFETQIIYDNSKSLDWEEEQQPGEIGKKVVSYELTLHNDKEADRKEIQSVVEKQPVKRIVKRGNKSSFGGDFAAALAKLRSCEGSYTSNTGNGYYGAYQFDKGTWAGSAPAGATWGNATPAQQDQAARNLYVSRGWSPWPSCGANLPDSYR
ncbi:DUF348 domain-containing protein [Candidatus Saccharibacteria bacterium]|nr:DUF348 domain-containing protein [Candidatus Saccharibacteria bacterium]MBP9132340.1 DUF348 domain-containing protein [Candidatus Saccharibacteria bacterium]